MISFDKKKQNMRLITLTILLSTSLGNLNAQTPDLQTEIDNQVWRPFIETWSNCDAAEFKLLHSDDVLRASGGNLYLGKEYKSNIGRSFKNCKDRNMDRLIAFTFVERTHRNNTGYEVGYYKITTKQANGNTNYSYGRFHVVLKKINNVWKIVQDWDTNKLRGVAINEEDFQSGDPLADSE